MDVAVLRVTCLPRFASPLCVPWAVSTHLAPLVSLWPSGQTPGVVLGRFLERKPVPFLSPSGERGLGTSGLLWSRQFVDFPAPSAGSRCLASLESGFQMRADIAKSGEATGYYGWAKCIGSLKFKSLYLMGLFVLFNDLFSDRRVKTWRASNL